MTTYKGQIVDIINDKTFSGKIEVENRKIVQITTTDMEYDNYIIPGFVDSHIHIESSMLPPAEFGRIAVQHGTVAAVCDPHEIANVMGTEGIEYMIENARQSPLKFYFSAPSCVPATDLETSGANITSKDLRKLFKKYPEVKFLGEMMNFPGVINDDEVVQQKLAIAKEYNKPIDGHAPGIVGEELKKYISSGISTDHECSTREEALEKLKQGMKIWIREGSAAKNFEELIPLAEDHFENMGFCSDDKHPDDLIQGHIDQLVKRAIHSGITKNKILQMASHNPVEHYDLEVGQLQEGDQADFLIINDFKNMDIKKTVINGRIIYEKGKTNPQKEKTNIINNFGATTKKPEDFIVPKKSGPINVIGAHDGDLFTEKLEMDPKIEDKQIVSDTERDILKIAHINRYKNEEPTVAFVKNFGLKRGAIASSVAHDSHNILVVGKDNNDISRAVNQVIRHKGGLSIYSEQDNIDEILKLPIAGLISDQDYQTIAEKYNKLEQLAQDLGSEMTAPFMTLSFLALLVIPEIKLSDRGLFNVNEFKYIDLN